MKVLILTQAVDRDDPVLGFFHSWLEEFAKHCEHVTVICLKKGSYELSKNVTVLSLGKERGASRITYIWNFYRYIWNHHRDYESVFVHMNQEYVLLGWKVWFILGKRVTLWRNHKKGSIWTRLAGYFVRTVFYTSPQAYVANFKNAIQMPIGIDTEKFTPQGVITPRSLLFLGRLDPVKKPEIFVAALKKLYEEKVPFLADMYGAPTYQDAAHTAPLATLAASLVAADVLRVQPSVPNEQTPAIYASHDVYVNLTPSGSFDKTIGEAMATGALVVAANDVLEGILPKELLGDGTVEATVESLRWALSRSPEERGKITMQARAYVVREHSLPLLVQRLMPYLRV